MNKTYNPFIISILSLTFVFSIVRAEVTPCPEETNFKSAARLRGASTDGIPLSFVSNQGQMDSDVRFMAESGAERFWVTDDEILFDRDGADGRDVVRLSFEGANTGAVSGVDRLPGTSNYFRGSDPEAWVTDVPMYAGVRHDDVYAGIDAVHLSSEKGLKSEFIVKPGSNPDLIKLNYDGVEAIAINDHGQLVLSTASGIITDDVPIAYQEKLGTRFPVDVRYALFDDGTVGFEIGDYDANLPLVIDPLIRWSSFLGGTLDDHGSAIESDSNGNLYVTGHTRSSDFPASIGAAQTVYGGGGRDAFAAKLSADGTTIIWCTYIGGTDTTWGDAGSAIAVDAEGAVYITGLTMSPDFPTTAGAYDLTYGGGTDSGDAFVIKISSDGSTFLYGTYLGGPDDDWGRGIDVDAQGDVYVTGLTNGGFPTTAGAYDVTYNGGVGGVGDVFFVKLSPDGSGAVDLLYGTYIGGMLAESGNAILADESGVAHISGFAMMFFPVTTGAFQTSFGGGTGDGFVLKIAPLGGGSSDLIYSTFFGGTDTDAATAIDIDGEGNIYHAGTTASSAGFPLSGGAYQTTHGGGTYDAYVSKLNPAGNGASDLLYSSYLGGNADEYPVGEFVHNGVGLELGCDDMVYLHAITQSSNFPTTQGAYDNNLSGGDDAALVKMNLGNNGASDLLYGTFLGGGGEEHWYGIAVTQNDNIGMIFGSTSLDYPGSTQPSDYVTTAGSFQPVYAGGYEDVAVSLAGFTDFGDAPDSYGTTIAANGPRHILGTLRLGAGWDAESDGQPNAAATGDDGGADWPFPGDEDGVLFLGSSASSGGPYSLPYVPGQFGAVQVTVTGTGSGWLSGWFDWNTNGIFDNPSERMVFQAVSPGLITIEFTVPASAVPAVDTYARFRLGPEQVDVSDPTATAVVCGGEVEDYQDIAVPVELSSFSATYMNGVVRLEWVTQSESENLGYHVYRSESVDGEFLRITDDMIPGAGNSTSENRYSFDDETVIAGHTYHYTLGDISSAGIEVSHGPVSVSIPLATGELVLETTVPSPITETGIIRFSIPEAGATRIVLFNIAGQQLRQLFSGHLEAGIHTISFDRANESGIRLRAGSYVLELISTSGTLSRTVIIAD